MLRGKTVLVTGSTSGIGEGVAKACANVGANVVLNGFGDAAQIEELRSPIEKMYGVKAMYSSADMSKPEEICEMVSEAIERFGAVDVLVNNAGIQHVEPIDVFSDSKWDAIIAINLSSAFHSTKAVAPKMKGVGAHYQYSSVHGLVASEYKSAYVAAKHGVVGLTKVTALDLAPFGVTANAICPGYVNTPLVQKQIPEQAKTHGISESGVVSKVMLGKHAIKKFVEVSDVAAMVMYLCSDAAQTLTGTALPLDGGWSAQ